MAYFCELDSNNVVLRTIVVHENDAVNGEAFCNALFGGRWVQTFDDNSTRKQYAGIGFAYDSAKDQFVAPKPFASWLLNANNDWQPPTSKPEGNYYWNESTLSWVAILVG